MYTLYPRDLHNTNETIFGRISLSPTWEIVINKYVIHKYNKSLFIVYLYYTLGYTHY